MSGQDALLRAALNIEKTVEELPHAGEVVRDISDQRIIAWSKSLAPLIGPTNANIAYKQARKVFNPVVDAVTDAYIHAGQLYERRGGDVRQARNAVEKSTGS